MGILEIVAKLKRTPHVLGVYTVVPEDLERFFDIEADTKAGSGMPMLNRALDECRRRSSFLVVASDGEGFDQSIGNEVSMVDERGKVVGRMVSPDQMDDFAGRQDVVWLSDDFVLFTDLIPNGEIKVVMNPINITVVGREDGAADAVAMSPAPPGDAFLRGRLGITMDSHVSLFVMGFNPS